MLRIAIDGACRRNGKPNCVASGGVYIQHLDAAGSTTKHETLSATELASTNQRGEMLALQRALRHIRHCEANSALIITDSEYLFNTMTKRWYDTWHYNDWRTSSGDKVKNADLWQDIMAVTSALEIRGVDICFFHIKGHVIPFGKVAAANALMADTTGEQLYKAVKVRYSELLGLRKDLTSTAQELSKRNNGFELDADTLKEFVTMNVVVDAVATQAVEAVDRKI